MDIVQGERGKEVHIGKAAFKVSWQLNMVSAGSIIFVS